MDIDIKENDILERSPELLDLLLKDHTTQEHIFWATDDYKELGEGYDYKDCIAADKITGENGLIVQPRVMKSKETQAQRIKEKAEVFTPSWVCNAQNNLVDNAWFGREGVFNKEITDDEGHHSWEATTDKIQFSEEPGKTWKDYVAELRMEITCGEAPYLASRYDTTTGETIPIRERIGLLDRKLRVVDENTDNTTDWMLWAKTALRATYGYEWQGDSLLLARESILYTFMDYYREKFGKEVPMTSLKGAAYIISWNLWQMDGLTFGLPGYEPKETVQADLFASDNPKEIPPREQFCVIKDFIGGKKVNGENFSDKNFHDLNAPKVVFKTLVHRR